MNTDSICSRCGDLFHCGVNDATPCWCATTLPASGPFDADAQSCLCPSCLTARVRQAHEASDQR